MKPEILSLDVGGFHNSNENSIKRLKHDGSYKDLSTIIITPGFGMIPTKAVASWINMMTPPNGKVVRLWPLNMEVGCAFSQCIEGILEHPELSKFKFVFTLEHDNIIPPDCLLKLLARMEEHPEFSVISGLYFTKGPGGVAQIWGNPKDPIPNFRPQLPREGELIESCGTGMGCTLYRLDMFKDERLRRPWFKTTASVEEGCSTQDLYHASDYRKFGYRCGVDCSIKSGHIDLTGEFSEGEKYTVW